MQKAVIFDMDGIIIDSEPLWKRAEIEVFATVGIDLNNKISAETAAMTTTEVTQLLYHQHHWNGKSPKQIEREVIDRVGNLIQSEGKPIEGIKRVIRFFRSKNYKVGLATNSPFRLIPIVLKKAGLAYSFDAISSAEFEKKGKPDPAVYRTTAKKLGVFPRHCLVFEDSITGMKAALAAGMTTIVMPPTELSHNPGYLKAHAKIEKYPEFTPELFEELTNTCLKSVI